jgi:hypothetical protein
MNSAVFCDLTPCSLAEIDRRFTETYKLNHQDDVRYFLDSNSQRTDRSFEKVISLINWTVLSLRAFDSHSKGLLLTYDGFKIILFEFDPKCVTVMDNDSVKPEIWTAISCIENSSLDLSSHKTGRNCEQSLLKTELLSYRMHKQLL